MSLSSIQCLVHDVVGTNEIGKEQFECEIPLEEMPGLRSITVSSDRKWEENLKLEVERGLKDCTRNANLRVYFI